MKEDIKSMTLPELTTWMSALGEKGFRAKQLYNWMHKNLVSSFDEMTNLSGALKSKLKEQADLVVLTPVDVRISSIDGTRKYLFRLSDGNMINAFGRIINGTASVEDVFADLETRCNETWSKLNEY